MSTQIKICDWCGKENEDNVIHCIGCGEQEFKLPTEIIHSTYSISPSSFIKTFLILTWIVCILIIEVKHHTFVQVKLSNELQKAER
jgi:uncharacterized membrane protein YvbJ